MKLAACRACGGGVVGLGWRGWRGIRGEAMYLKGLTIVLVAAVAASPAQAENWRASSKTDAAAAFIDTSAIRRDGDRVTFRREVRFAEPRVLQGDVRFDRLRTLYEGDCKAMTLQSLDISARLGETILLSSAERGELETAKPGTTAETDLKAACHGQWPS